MTSGDREVLGGAIWLYKQNGEVSPSLLAESLEVDEGQVFQALRRLEREGLIEASSRLMLAEVGSYQPTDAGIRRLMRAKGLSPTDDGYAVLEELIARGYPRIA